MATPTPALETVITAIKTRMDTIASLGTVYTGFHGLEDDIEHIEVNSLISAGSMNAWFIDLKSVEEFEGPATGEVYERYHLEIRYWSLRTANADWSKEARVKAEAVRDELQDNAAVFAISSQQQLHTPTTVQIESHGQHEIRGTEGAQLVYLTVLSLAVEARRFA